MPLGITAQRLLLASLAANLALAVALASRTSANSRLFSTDRAPRSIAPAPTAIKNGAAAPSAATDTDAEKWSSLTGGNLPDVVARLRAGGIPSRYLRAIVGALVAEHFADRHKAIIEAMSAKPWWEGQLYMAIAGDSKIAELNRRLALDERAMLSALIGSEPAISDYDRAWHERKYGSLDTARNERVSHSNRDYTDMMAEVRAQAHDIILPEDREKLSYLEREKNADLAKILSPEEIFEFNLRSTGTANRLRTQLANFDPTEEEFRAIFKLHQAVDAQFADGRLQNLTLEQRQQRNAALKALDDQIQAVLSPERFADYQKAQAPRPSGTPKQ